MNTQALHILVRGRVQGVFFRASAQEKANEENISGWVRNHPNGTVEIHAEGSEQALARFVEWCRLGPPAAKVTDLDIEPVSVAGSTSFSIR